MDLYVVRQQLNLSVSLNAMKLRVTDYSRVSTLHLQQKSSLRNQIEHFDEMIKSNLNWTYVKGYVDDGISGTTDYKRDNFMKMIDDAKAGKFDLIITKEISRFSRNTLDSIKYTRELLSYGVAVLFVNDNINTALPDAELRLTIMASMAQDEIRRLSERVKFGMQQAIKNGHILGNNIFYGYKKNKETGCLYIIESQAEVIRKLFILYAIDELSVGEIARRFNQENILTIKGKKWLVSTLIRMIKNIKYKGYYCGRKTEVIDYMTKKVKYFEKDDWVIFEDKERIPPIVDDELWDRANARLLERSFKFGNDYKENKIMYQRKYPLSAKIYCSDHNTVFHRRKQLKSSDDITWMCSEFYANGKKACNSPNIRESEIYSIFDDIIKNLKIDLNNISTLLFDLYQNSKSNIGIDNKMIALKDEQEKILQKKDKLLELAIDGSLSNSEFNDRNKKLNSDLEILENKMVDLERSKENFENIKEKNNKLEKILNQKVNSNITREKLINLLLDKIIASKIGDDRNNIELQIFFKFSPSYFKQEEDYSLISNIENFKCFFRNKYEYKRGYNTTGTKRYTCKYSVSCYVCI